MTAKYSSKSWRQIVKEYTEYSTVAGLKIQIIKVH
jgi:hypothetical protein